MDISLGPELLAYIGSFPITNTFVVTIFLSVCMLFGSYLLQKNMKTVPGMFQNIAEVAVEFLFNMVESVTHDRKQTKKFFPIVATIFITVIFANWVELIPGLGTVGVYAIHEGKETLIPFLRSSSADLNMTLAIALISVGSTQFFGITSIGIVKYAKKFFVSPFKKPYGIGTFVGVLELISEVSKILSFSFRLFGNIFAGEVLLLVVLMLVPYIAPVPFLALEVFVGFIQALVFAMLTLVFMKIATMETH